MANKFITVKRASDLLQCTPHYVRRMIKEGKIVGHQIKNSNRWEIDRASIEQYQKTDIFKQDLLDMQIPQSMTLKEAIENVEDRFEGDVITFIMNPNYGSIIEPNDALQLNHLLSTMEASYKSTTGTGKKFKKIILVLHSGGGILEAAIKFVRIINAYADRLEVIVPLMAKSAATIMTLKADDFFMFPISELGPIDPMVQSPSNPGVTVPAHVIKQFVNENSSKEKSSGNEVLLNKLHAINDPFIFSAYQAAEGFAKEELKKCLESKKLTSEQVVKAESLFIRQSSHAYPILLNDLNEFGLGKKIKIGVESSSINALMSLVTNFMSSHNIIKIIGNRHQNNNTVLPPSLVKQKTMQTSN